MAKNLIVSTLALLALTASATATAAPVKKPKALRDGFALAGAYGELTRPDHNAGDASQYISFGEADDIWLFKFDADVSDDQGRIKAGWAVQVLPSAALEKMIADANDSAFGAKPIAAEELSAPKYRLWGKITKYRGRNFIFPTYFLSAETVKRTEPATQEAETKIQTRDPNDPLSLPPEIIKKLQARKVIRTEQLRKGSELKQDSILADRTGFIVPLSRAPDRSEFVLDALGRNVQRLSIALLPCQALELAQRAESGQLEQLRFKAAGIVTRYKGRHFLLLERAARVYSHGNFPG